MRYLKAVRQERMTSVEADIYKAKADKVSMEEREAALKKLGEIYK